MGGRPLLKHVANEGRALELGTAGLGKYEQADGETPATDP